MMTPRELQAVILAEDSGCADFVSLDVPKWLEPPRDEPAIGDDGQPMVDQNGRPLFNYFPGTPNPAWIPGPEVFARDAKIAQILSAKRTRFVSRRLSSLGLAERFPASGQLPGPLYCESVLQKMEGFAAAAVQEQDPAIALFGGQIRRQMAHLAGDGIDFGAPALHTMFDAMVSAGAITENDARALKSVALEPEVITADEVSRALRGPWGDESQP